MIQSKIFLNKCVLFQMNWSLSKTLAMSRSQMKNLEVLYYFFCIISKPFNIRWVLILYHEIISFLLDVPNGARFFQLIQREVEIRAHMTFIVSRKWKVLMLEKGKKIRPSLLPPAEAQSHKPSTHDSLCFVIIYNKLRSVVVDLTISQFTQDFETGLEQGMKTNQSFVLKISKSLNWSQNCSRTW